MFSTLFGSLVAAWNGFGVCLAAILDSRTRSILLRDSAHRRCGSGRGVAPCVLACLSGGCDQPDDARAVAAVCRRGGRDDFAAMGAGASADGPEDHSASGAKRIIGV